MKEPNDLKGYAERARFQGSLVTEGRVVFWSSPCSVRPLTNACQSYPWFHWWLNWSQSPWPAAPGSTVGRRQDMKDTILALRVNSTQWTFLAVHTTFSTRHCLRGIFEVLPRNMTQRPLILTSYQVWLCDALLTQYCWRNPHHPFPQYSKI